MASVQSAVLSFGVWKLLRKAMPSSKPFTVAENVLAQTVAVAAATLPLAAGFVGIVPALRILETKGEIPAGQTLPLQTGGSQIVWCLAVCFLGVFLAVPLRGYVKTLVFPSGTATAVAIQTLHAREGTAGSAAAGAAAGTHTSPPPLDDVVTAGDSFTASGASFASGHKAPDSGSLRGRGAANGLTGHSSAAAEHDRNALLEEGAADVGSSTFSEPTTAASAPHVGGLSTATPTSAGITSAGAVEPSAAAGDESSLASAFRTVLICFGCSAALTLAAFFFPVLTGIPLASYVGLPGVSAWGWVLTLSLSYVGQGSIMGMTTCASMLSGALVAWGMIGPSMQAAGVVSKPMSSGPGGGRGFLIWVSLAVMLAEAGTSAVITIAQMLRDCNWAALKARLTGSPLPPQAHVQSPRRVITAASAAPINPLGTAGVARGASASRIGGSSSGSSGNLPIVRSSSKTSAGRVSLTDSGLKGIQLLDTRDAEDSVAIAAAAAAAGDGGDPGDDEAAGPRVFVDALPLSSPAPSDAFAAMSLPIAATPGGGAAASIVPFAGSGADASSEHSSVARGAPGYNSAQKAGPAGPAEPEQVLPVWAWAGGLLACTVLAVAVLVPLAGVSPGESISAVLFSLPISIVAVRALGATDLLPVSGLGKITQLLFGAMFPHNMIGNVIAGGVAEAGAQQAGDLMQDLKTGYLLGVPLRAQFAGQLLGSLVSVFASTLAFYVFDRAYSVPSPSLPAPTAAVWVSMAELMAGTGSIPRQVIPFAVGGAVLSAILTVALVIAESAEHDPSEDTALVLEGPHAAASATGSSSTSSSGSSSNPRWRQVVRFLKRVGPYLPSPTAFGIGESHEMQGANPAQLLPVGTGASLPSHLRSGMQPLCLLLPALLPPDSRRSLPTALQGCTSRPAGASRAWRAP